MAEDNGFKGRDIGLGEGLGTGNLPMPKNFTGGSDDFFVQFTNETDGSYTYERENGPMAGIHDCCDDMDD
jgi:hypothetical protein